MSVQFSVEMPGVSVSVITNYHPVRNPSGTSLPIYRGEDGFYYVEAKDGLEYAIKVTKFTRGRLEVIGSVDGRDTLQNAPADIHHTSGMVMSGRLYVIPGYGQEHTSPFKFTARNWETVAHKATGSDRNLGVIAVAYYREYVPFPEPRSLDIPMGAAKGGLESSDPYRGGSMGTKMGDRVDHRNLGSTQFVRATTAPEAVAEIYPKSRQWLIDHGLINQSAHDSDHPSGFPGDQGCDYNR